MKILAVADVESKLYYDYYRKGMLDEFDLILACGDLHREYLEFLVTMAHCPLLYVRGNHDDSFATNPPEGCVCVEDQLYRFRGVRILGLGGSRRYRQGLNMYTEKEMMKRIRRLSFKIWRAKGFDILLTHSPARHINDMEGLPHRGFECFVTLLDKYAPKYFIHGHIHKSYGGGFPQKMLRNQTIIINADEYCIIEMEDLPLDGAAKVKRKRR